MRIYVGYFECGSEGARVKNGRIGAISKPGFRQGPDRTSGSLGGVGSSTIG